MDNALEKLINEELRTFNVIDAGISSALAHKLDKIIRKSVKDSVRLYNVSESLLAGIMANPNTPDTYCKLDVCAEAVELADTLITAVVGKVDEHVNNGTEIH